MPNHAMLGFMLWVLAKQLVVDMRVGRKMCGKYPFKWLSLHHIYDLDGKCWHQDCVRFPKSHFD